MNGEGIMASSEISTELYVFTIPAKESI